MQRSLDNYMDGMISVSPLDAPQSVSVRKEASTHEKLQAMDDRDTGDIRQTHCI